MAQWMQCSFIQTSPTWADSVCSLRPDTHDGFDEDTHKRVKESQSQRDKAFKSARERLREVIERAWDGPAPEGSVAAEVKTVASPYVERLESGSLRIDYRSLQRQDDMATLLAFQDSLRSEYQARMALEQDDEEVMILALWS